MSALLDWIKANSRDGANFAEVEELIMQGSIEGISTKERALELLKDQKYLKAAYDSEISKKIENHDNRFREEKLPSLLEAERERLRAELNPQETPEQKQLRAMQEKIDSMTAKENKFELEKRLRSKAKELDYDPERATRFAALGENAETFLSEEAGFYKQALEAQREKLVNGALGGNPPAGGESISADLTEAKISNMSIAEIEASVGL